MLDVKHIQAVAAVIEEQSFEKAAVMLSISQSAISQRVKTLEGQLGQALLIRSSPVRPTEAGRKIFGYYQQMSLLQHELMEELNEDLSPKSFKPRDKLRIALNVDSLDTWFMDAITPVVEKHKLLLELRVDDQEATHDLLKNGEVIGCISSSSDTLQGCHCVPLGSMKYYACCSIDYKNEFFSSGLTKEHFLSAPAVEFNFKDHLNELYLKQYWHINESEYPFHQVPSSSGYIDFLKKGMGWGMISDINTNAWLKANNLVQLTPEQYIAVPLYWHVWNFKSDIIRSISHQIVTSAKQLLNAN